MVISINVLESFVLSLPVKRFIDDGMNTIFITVDSNSAKLLKPGLTYTIISKNGNSIDPERKGVIKGLSRLKDGIAINL
jgi:hypothetical protein